MTEGERLKFLRKALNIKQGDFAKKISTTQGHISDIENGRKNLSDRTIKLICLENWNGKTVNESWLLKGTGDMFLKDSEENQVKTLVSSLLEPDKNKFYDIILEVIKGYQQLSPTSQQALNELADNILNNQKKQQHESEKMERNSATMLREEFEECPRTPESMDQACSSENHKAI